MNTSFDVVIAGAGLVGLSLATMLQRAGLSVALVDRLSIAPVGADPATWDSRVYAISPGSASFLRAAGAWQSLSCDRVAAIETMRVEGDGGALLDFSAYEMGERALAWIVEERALREALAPAVRRCGAEVIDNVAMEALAFTAEAATLRLADGRTLAARLIVAADGVRSWVRAAAGISASPRSYGQTAVVANFECERAHHGCARQWFRADGGVLAWLPLPGRRISIVWSAPDELAHELLALDGQTLSARIEDAGGSALGRLTCITAPAAFPLQYMRVATSVAHRIALVGDAAHGIHPLAGQGVNLGFGDAQALAAVLAERGPVADAGAPILLERYARRRALPVFAMQAVTDGLARLFGSVGPWQKVLRNSGMSAVDRLPVLKRALAQPALR